MKRKLNETLRFVCFSFTCWLEIKCFFVLEGILFSLVLAALATCPSSIRYPPERQSSSCPQPIIHHSVLWVWVREKSNEQRSCLSASRSSEAEFELVMNLVGAQQVSLQLTYIGSALNFNVFGFFTFSFITCSNALRSFFPPIFYLCGLICNPGAVGLSLLLWMAALSQRCCCCHCRFQSTMDQQ